MEQVRGASASVGAGMAWEGQRGVSGARARSRSPSELIWARPATAGGVGAAPWLRPSEEAVIRQGVEKYRNTRIAVAGPTPFPGPSEDKWLLRLILAATAGVGQPLQVRRPLVGSNTGKAAACIRSEERAAEL